MLVLILRQTMTIKSIGWVNDYKIFGGAEDTQNELINICPYDIKYITATDFTTGYELFILNNFRTFTKEQIAYLCQTKYVACWHDVLFQDGGLITRIRDNALANIFLSPLHKAIFQKKYGLPVNKPSFVVPPLFPSIIPHTKKRKGGICYYGSIWPHKGIDNCLLWARKNSKVIDFYGQGNEILVQQLKQSKYANYEGTTNNSILREYNYFIHMPDEIEAFGRSVFEAYISGCHILHNNKIGAFTFDWNYEDRKTTLQRCNNAGNALWDIILKLVNHE